MVLNTSSVNWQLIEHLSVRSKLRTRFLKMLLSLYLLRYYRMKNAILKAAITAAQSDLAKDKSEPLIEGFVNFVFHDAQYTQEGKSVKLKESLRIL